MLLERIFLEYHKLLHFVLTIWTYFFMLFYTRLFIGRNHTYTHTHTPKLGPGDSYGVA